MERNFVSLFVCIHVLFIAGGSFGFVLLNNGKLHSVTCDKCLKFSFHNIVCGTSDFALSGVANGNIINYCIY